MPPPEPRQSLPDSDPEETDEWMEALRSVVASQGVEILGIVFFFVIVY